MRGRKRIASAIHEKSGAFKKDPQRRNPNEPQPIKGRPDVPDFVESAPLALAKWNHLCEILDELGLLSKSDVDLMAVYSVTWADFVSLRKDIATEGAVIKGATGQQVINPKHRLCRQAVDQLYKLGAEFGLSPSSRTRLSAIPREIEDDPIADFFAELGVKNN